MRRTELEVVRHSVKHLGVKVGVEDVVLVGDVLGRDQDRVSLGDRDGEVVDRVGLDVDTVNLNDSPVSTIKVVRL